MERVQDVFPFFARLFSQEETPQLSESATDFLSDEGNLESFASTLTDVLAKRENVNTTLGELFDRVADEVTIESLGLAFVRTENCLLRDGYSNFGLLKSLSYSDCLEIRNFGKRTIVDLLSTLTREQVFGVNRSTEVQQVSTVNRLFDPDYFVSESLQSVGEAINWLVADAVYGFGRVTGAGILDSGSWPGQMPYARVAEAREYLASIGVVEWLSEIPTIGLEELLAPFVAQLNNNERRILVDRISSIEPSTLDEVGSQISLTRERVRQIEKSLKSEFAQFVQSESLIKLAIHNLKRDLGFPLRLETLAEENESLLCEIEGLGRSPLHLFAGFGAVQIQDGWVCEDFTRVDRKISEIFQVSGKDSTPVSLEQLSDQLQTIWPHLTAAIVVAWLTHLGFREYRGYWFSARGLSVDRICEKILEISDEPIETDDLFEALGKDRSERSFSNALASNENIVRVSRTAWGIKNRGAEQYLGIRETLIAFIEENGSTPFDEVQRKFVSKYGVKASSVKAYATSYPLELSNGYIRKTNVQPVSRKSISKTRNLYRLDHLIAYRITITSEHLRGSGSTCPAALAGFFGIKAGEKRVFRSQFGDFKISRVSHLANLSSVKLACEALGIGRGEHLLITFAEDSVEFKKLVSNNPDSPLIGQIVSNISGAGFPERFLSALDLSPESSLEEAKSLLVARGELDLANEVASFQSKD